MERQEIHVHIHTSRENLGFVPRIKVQQYRAVWQKDNQLWLLNSWWSRKTGRLFTEGFEIWKNLEASNDANLAGGSVETGHLDLENTNIMGKLRNEFGAAKGLHLSARDMVQKMKDEALEISRRRNIPEEIMLNYTENRTDVLIQTWSLSTRYATELKGLIYQRPLPVTA